MTSLVDLGKRLLEASKKGHADEVSMLMTSGAPFTTDWLGTSPLHLAAQYGHIATAEVLLRAGVSRDARTKVDRTPIHLAAQHGHYGIVDLLIAGGASINHTDMLNMTPLHWACESGHHEIVKLLLKNGANMDIESKFRQTPLDIARNKGYAEIVEELLAEENSDRSQGIKRQSQTSLTLGSIKKRQKTRKFPMTAGSWSGLDGPTGQNMSVLRTHSETMAPLVSAAALAISSEQKNVGKRLDTVTTQDSSVLDALATLATATLHQSSCIPSAPTNTAPISAGGKQNVTLAPLTIPPPTGAPLLSNITPMWPGIAPLQSPLAALSAISALTSSPAQPSPLNIPMHQLPIALPVGFNSQSGTSTNNQVLITQLPIAGQQSGTAPSTITVSSITGSAVSSVIDQTASSTTNSDGTHAAPVPTTYLVPIMGGGASTGQGHFFISTPDGTQQLLVDGSQLNQVIQNTEITPEKASGATQDGLFQTVQLSPAILQQANQGALDNQNKLVHSILTQPVHITTGQVAAGQLPQIQMALAQVLPNHSEAQATQATTNTQGTPQQVLIQTLPVAAGRQEDGSQAQAVTDVLPVTHQQLLQQLLQGESPVRVGDKLSLSMGKTVSQTPLPTTMPSQMSIQPHRITSNLPASAALQTLINQNLQNVGTAAVTQSPPQQTAQQQQQQQKVFVDLQKLVETKEREVRARKELETRLAEAKRDSEKFQSELHEAQKEAESYKGRLQAIDKDHKDDVTKDEHLRQLFAAQQTGAEGTADHHADMLSRVAQQTGAVAQVVVAETVVDEGDISRGVPSDPK